MTITNVAKTYVTWRYLITGLHKTGIRGIQDTRQIVDGETNDIENNDRFWQAQSNPPFKMQKVGSRFLIRQLMKKTI